MTAWRLGLQLLQLDYCCLANLGIWLKTGTCELAYICSSKYDGSARQRKISESGKVRTDGSMAMHHKIGQILTAHNSHTTHNTVLHIETVMMSAGHGPGECT